MFVFSVRDMRVSGQADAVLAAVKHVDENASVLVNLWAQEVQISPTTAGATELHDAIVHAGFDPILRNGGGPSAQGRRQAPHRIPFVRLDDFSALSGAASAAADMETASAGRPGEALRDEV
jgi:copper chaperone CopZ